MQVRLCSLLMFVILLLFCHTLTDAFVLRERRSEFDFDLYDEQYDDVNSEALSNKMYTLCARLHKRSQDDKRVASPLITRMCDLLS